MSRDITLTLSVEAWDTVVNCVPKEVLLNVETLQHIVRFVSAYKTALDGRVTKPVIYEEEDPDSE